MKNFTEEDLFEYLKDIVMNDLDSNYDTLREKNTKSNKLFDIFDNVNHPSHYSSENGLEVIDVIDSFTKDLDGAESFYIGNVIKYVCRFKNKNGVEDLKKANWYLNRLIEMEDIDNDTKNQSSRETKER